MSWIYFRRFQWEWVAEQWIPLWSLVVPGVAPSTAQFISLEVLEIKVLRQKIWIQLWILVQTGQLTFPHCCSRVLSKDWWTGFVYSNWRLNLAVTVQALSSSSRYPSTSRALLLPGSINPNEIWQIRTYPRTIMKLYATSLISLNKCELKNPKV